MIVTVTLNASIDKLYTVEAQEPYSVMRVQQTRNTAGGKGLNVSRVAALLGESITAAGFVGGFSGQYFESLISQQMIHKAFTHVAGETRSCINVWDCSCNRSTEYLEAGAPISPEELARFRKDFQHLLPYADAVTLSGSLPVGVPPDCYGQLITLCHQAGKPVLLDSSGEALRHGITAKPDFVKPNADEMSQWLGHEVKGREAFIQAALQLRAQGIKTVVISLGAEGALMACEDGLLLGIPPQIVPLNTVGCGDSMVAGFAVSTVRRQSAAESLRLAVAVSAANALSMETGTFAAKDLEWLLKKVEIKKLNE